MIDPPRRVVIFGTSISSAYLSGSTTLFRGLAEAFLEIGACVTFVEEDHAWLESHTDYTAENPNLSVQRYGNRAELEHLLFSCVSFSDADLVLKFSGSSLGHDRFLDEWLARNIGPLDCVLVYADPDAPMRLPYIVGHPRFYLRSVLSSFDGVWTLLGGDRAVSEYLSIGACAAWALPAAIDPKRFCMSAHRSRERFGDIDLLFVGNPAAGREKAFNDFFLAAARLDPRSNFALAGAEWDASLFPENVRLLGYVHSDDLPDLYGSARLTLNITREEMANYGDAAALRLFEAAACGACIVSDYWSGIERVFVPDLEIMVARSASDVTDLLCDLDGPTAKMIGERARLRVLRDHTADIRVAELLSVLSQL